VQGRELREADIAQKRALIERHPEWTRRRLSVALCELLDWRSLVGVTQSEPGCPQTASGPTGRKATKRPPGYDTRTLLEPVVANEESTKPNPRRAAHRSTGLAVAIADAEHARGRRVARRDCASSGSGGRGVATARRADLRLARELAIRLGGLAGHLCIALMAASN